LGVLVSTPASACQGVSVTVHPFQLSGDLSGLPKGGPP
jgi:hypothetical protein